MLRRVFKYTQILIFGVIIYMSGCEQKFDLTQLPDPGQPITSLDTNYVEIYPPWGGFESPRAIIVGNDQLIYVADYGRDEIVMMDAGGTVLNRRTVMRPISIAHNSKLDLYVGGETISQNGDTIGALFRIFLVRFDTSNVIRVDTIVDSLTGRIRLIPIRRDTSYFLNHNIDIAPMHTVWKEPARPQRRFTGIGILPNNDYLVARVGPENSSFVDPDARVLYFNKGDTLITPLGDLVTRPSGGTAITDIRNLTGIMVFPSSRDFILTQSIEGVAYGAIWMVYQKTLDFEGWLPKYDPSKAEQRVVDFIRPYRFRQASGVAYDRRRRDVFIIDSGLDSLIKFNRNGQFKTESFGYAKTTSGLFPGLNRPNGVAFSNDCTLYIADTGNKVIRRFKLSNQTQCN